MIIRKLTLFGVGLTALSGCLMGGDDLDMRLSYDERISQVVVDLARPLESGEAIYLRTRRGSFGTLDCNQLKGEVEPLTGGGARIEGPPVDPVLLRPFYGPEWGQGEPTQEMLAQMASGTDSILDACVVRDGEVVQKVEMDFFRAWDNGRARGYGGKADDPSGETRINSVQEYGERCVAELGEIPFFESTGDGTYTTYDCLESTPIPMTQTDASGNVTNPDAVVNQCDKPQYIYSLCEPGPRVASRINDEGTRWVMLCRKSIGGYESDQYNDIAMIGHNPYTGKTCYFQNALYQKKDGGNIPHPADREKSTNLWSGIHGGIGSGIECAKCHDADAWIHSPWIDGAKDANGRPIVPKMGVDEDYPIGANDAPYSIVNLGGQGWTMPEQLVSPEANACLRCHRIGSGRWLEWASRLDGTDTAFRNITTEEFRKFHNMYWMPPDLEGVTASTWATSEFGRSLEFIKGCFRNRAGCDFEPIPGSPGGGGGGGGAGQLRNPVTMADDDLALKSLQLLGANVPGASNRCSECHSLTRTNLRKWEDDTNLALADCLSETSGGTNQQENLGNHSIANGEFKTFGPYEVATGGKFSVSMTGSGDADLHVRKNAEVTTEEYDCRPYGGDSNESCGDGDFANTGPGKFYVGVSGYGDANDVSLTVTYTVPGNSMRTPREMVDCIRMDPSRSDSPFMPAKIGIYTAAAHLPWFQNLFEAAYPASQWSTEYAKFRMRVSMPKGNHPRFTQDELDIVAEWYARGLPQLENTLEEEPPPSGCTTDISSDLRAHVTAMRTEGWQAVNEERGMNMLSLGNFPRAADRSYGSGWDAVSGTTLKVLRELDYGTFFWMRSSADGRFVANGADSGAGAMIADLANDRDIPTHAAYDPGFFPDNSGFVFQGTSIGAGFCNMSLLTSQPGEINFSEPQCSSASSIALYQHLGAALDGGDYFVVNSQFESDNGGHGSTTSDPGASFSSTAEIRVTPMVHNGTHFVERSALPVVAPFEGDSVLSPSTRLMVSRLAGPGSEQLGYVLRKVQTTRTATGYSITMPEIGRICEQGGKPAVSFDERWMVYHHYESDGSANLHVVDLGTGEATQITNMRTGQYALFPHFRSDGWIYFLVRDSNSGKEYVVASDAARVLASQ